jgi:hypothetical protein
VHPSSAFQAVMIKPSSRIRQVSAAAGELTASAAPALW